MERKKRRVPWTTRITEVRPDQLRTHGVDQREIIRNFSYEEMVFFLLTGRKPTQVERELLRAVIVSHVSHGITGQSTLAVRMAADCRSGFLHALIAGFSTGAGIYHQGGLEGAMLELRKLAALDAENLESHIAERVRAGDRIIGYGHRYLKRTEVRAQLLFDIAAELKFYGVHMQLAKHVEGILLRLKRAPMNIEAAGGSILLDLGIDPTIAHLIIIIGRSPMFAAAYLERLAEERRPFQKIEVSDVVDR